MSDSKDFNSLFNDFLLSILNGNNADLVSELRYKWKEYLNTPIVDFTKKEPESKQQQSNDWEIVSFRGTGTAIEFTNEYIWYLKANGKYSAYGKEDGWLELTAMLKGKNSVEDGQIEIHEVRRISDGEVFKVGDVIESREGEYCNWKNFYKIISMSTKSGLLAFEIMDIQETNPTGSIWREIENIRKPKLPLFTTEDGVDKFENDNCWFVDINKYENGVCRWSNLPSPLRCNGNDISTYKYFHSPDEGKRYILENKPISISYKDISSLFPECGYDFHGRIESFFKSKIQP